MNDEITREVLHSEVNAAESRSVAAMNVVTRHFDQRLKDSERVLTWRMIAVVGGANAIVALADVFSRGSLSGLSAVVARFRDLFI